MGRFKLEKGIKAMRRFSLLLILAVAIGAPAGCDHESDRTDTPDSITGLILNNFDAEDVYESEDVEAEKSVNPRTGLAVIGCEAFSRASSLGIADACLHAGGRVELSALFQSFSPNDPSELRRVIRTILREGRQPVTLTLYLDSGPNRRGGNGQGNDGAYFQPFPGERLSTASFWNLVSQGPAGSARSARLYAEWQRQYIQPCRQLIQELRDYAASIGRGSRLFIRDRPRARR